MLPTFRAIVVLAACWVLTPAVLAGSASIGVAISLKESITEIAKEYEQETGDKITLTFGSSGQILGQIRGGAPLDGFISAANQQITATIEDGLANSDTRRVVVTNSLVLIAPPASTLRLAKFDDLAKPAVRRIAIGEPKTVPCGLYTNDVFISLTIIDKVKERLVYASNVRQVLDYVQRGEVDAGVVYLTDARQAGAGVTVIATADPSLHQPIVYPAVILKKAAHQDVAGRFLDYLRSEKAKAIFTSRGFSLPQAALATHTEP